MHFPEEDEQKQTFSLPRKGRTEMKSPNGVQQHAQIYYVANTHSV